MQIKKIIITGDVQRPNPQHMNIECIYHLLRRQIERLTGVTVELMNLGPGMTFEEHLKDSVPRPYGESPAFHFWGQDFDPREALWICFEANFNFIKQCEEIGAKYIDIWVHPVRFMRDLCFAVKSNFMDVSRFNLRHYEIENEVQFMRAALMYRDGIGLPDKTMLLIGQTSYDKSVMKDGRFWSLPDFKDRIFKEAAGFDAIIYKPHPSSDVDPIKVVQDIFDGSGLAASIVSTNIYRLLCEPRVKKVMGLSSSVLEEALWFDKESVSLLDLWWTDYKAVQPSNLFSFGFWSVALDGVFELKSIRDGDPVCYPNMMRTLFNSKWGYPL